MFKNNQISIATANQLPQILLLLNKAYRGEAAKSGWTTESNLIAGDVRTTSNELQKTYEKEGSVFLVYKNEATQLEGCLNLQLQNDRLYLGMFAVNPALQGAGIGKQLLYAAEAYAKANGIGKIFMIVISLRTELIAWYERHGYALTGNSFPFEEDGYSGRHLQKLIFVELEKTVVKS